ARVVRLLDRGQEGQVDAEGLVGHLAAAADFLGQRRRGGLGQGSDHAQAAGIGHGRGQLGIAYMVHATLDDRMLDTKELGDSCFHALPAESSEAHAQRVHDGTECRRGDGTWANPKLTGYSAGLWGAATGHPGGGQGSVSSAYLSAASSSASPPR